MADLTTIPLKKATRDRLRAFGRKGESYDALLHRLMDGYDDARAVVRFEQVE